ncbi:uncharacterized protein LOC102232537 [Xiphophorus maculatus]|uniref:uncharacterized protein LOC102232537 n=1 Tax=Xiphophorus maculatus TaxID=8083 RepID=UPI000C6D5A42|nr:uncharacterized protein LOC102232537 [Xiphophorus maculatus]
MGRFMSKVVWLSEIGVRHRNLWNYLTWALVNGPVGVINFIINAFYIFCIVCPLHGERIKKPLKLLLGSLVVSTIVYFLTAFRMFFSEKTADRIAEIYLVITLGCLSSSVSSSVWLNFFYYTQFVPAQRAIFIWIKKNIKPIIFFIFLLENIYSLLDLVLVIMAPYPTGSELNMTSAVEQASICKPVEELLNQTVDIYAIMVIIKQGHFYLSFVVMMTSSYIIVAYIGMHIQRMVINGQSLSSARLSSQLRVTITGIIPVIPVFFLRCLA